MVACMKLTTHLKSTRRVSHHAAPNLLTAKPDRGDIKLIVANHTEFPFILQAGVAVAHLIITPYLPSNVVLVSHLEDSVRGSNGFGSTTNGSNQYVLDNKEPMIYTKVVKDALPLKLELPKN